MNISSASTACAHRRHGECRLAGVAAPRKLLRDMHMLSTSTACIELLVCRISLYSCTAYIQLLSDLMCNCSAGQQLSVFLMSVTARGSSCCCRRCCAAAAAAAGVPVTNYGLFLSWVQAPEAMRRVLEPWGVDM
jgi:hypothetical protein